MNSGQRCKQLAVLMVLSLVPVLLYCVREQFLSPSHNLVPAHSDDDEALIDAFCSTNHTCPNIIYLLADDMGYGDVEYNGGRARTPNLNEMASGQHSIHFTRFYSGGPVCSPTRGTLLTGRNHNRYCIWHADLGVPTNDHECPSLVPLPTSELTLPEILRKHGYHTSIYGKWHLGDLKQISGGNKRWPVSHPGMHGFTDWLVTERHTMSLLPNCKCTKEYQCIMDGRQYNPFCCRNYWSMNPYTNTLEKYQHQIFEDSHFLVDRFEEFVAKRRTTKPFFIILSFHTVHTEYLATPYWYDYYESITERKSERHYLGAISAMDEAVGRVRNILKQHNLYSNTMLWFSSDNGPQTKTPGSSGGLRGHKGELSEGGIRVPGIIEWPAVIHSNRRSDIPVVTNDLLPTVVDILGIDIPQDRPIDGKSIVPILLNQTHQRGDTIKFAFHIKRGDLKASFTAAVVGDQFKLLMKYKNGKMETLSLYDLLTDFGERNNVSDSHTALTLSMKREMEHFLKSVTRSAKDVGCIGTHDRRYSEKCYVNYS